MTISDIAIRRPVFTAMMSLTLVVLGVVGLTRLGTDLYPDVSFPFVTIRTVYPGAGPEDLERDVTRPIEDALAGISGIEKLSSQSQENVSLVFVEFKLGVPLGEAVQQVRDKVGEAQGQLPSGTEPPVISRFDIGAQPVLVFSATSGRDPIALRELLDDQVRPRLEQNRGVAAVRVLGGGKPEISVELFGDRLTQLGLSPDAVFQRIRVEHLDLPAGRYGTGETQTGVRVQGQFADEGALRRMVVATAPDGTQVRLSDVALVRRTMKEPVTLVRTNGVDSIAVEVVKQVGGNSAAVANAVKKLLPELEKQYGFKADILIDQSIVIEANAREVWIALFFGGVMAVLIILLFLLDLRGTLISALALPTSVMGTLFVMYLLGYSVNQMTLLGLSLAIGLLIDDAVVVRESITRRLERGDTPADAASKGTQEIALAVLATTFSLVAVFVPVAFMPGDVGLFFRQFGLSVTAAVLISLFVAFTLDPMLSAKLVKKRVLGEACDRNAAVRWLRSQFERLESFYGATLDWVLRNRKATVLGALALSAGVIGIGTRLGSEFMPQEDRGVVIVHLDFPPGTSLAQSSRWSSEPEAAVRTIPDVTTLYSVIGFDGDARRAHWRVVLADKIHRTDSVNVYKDRIRKILGEWKKAKFTVSDPEIIEGMGDDYPPILMKIVGPDFKVLREEAEKLAGLLRSIPGTADVILNDSQGEPELRMNVKRDQTARMNIPAGAIAMQVRLASQGEVAGRVRIGRSESEIRVRLAGEERNSPEALGRLLIYTPKGPAALSDLALFEKSEGPAVIERERRERQISVQSQIAAGYTLGDVVEKLHQHLNAHPAPSGYTYYFEGMQEELEEMDLAMFGALALALIFVFMVLASQFESLVHPFTIMLSLPLALVGAVIALIVAQRPFSLGVYIGVILLMGLVTKNAILLVDGALQHIREGEAPVAAVRKAGPRRLRPILMTSAAMVLGMLPTALGSGTGSEFRSPMAIAVIGGVLTSTLLTLWVVPVIFIWFERLRDLKPGRPGTRAPPATQTHRLLRHTPPPDGPPCTAG